MVQHAMTPPRLVREFPRLTFTARNGSGEFADECRAALTTIHALRAAAHPITPPARHPDDQFHNDLRRLFALIAEGMPG